MSPRNPDDMPVQSQKRIPTGMFVGCGIIGLIIAALAIWIIMQIVNTVIDGTGANDPETTDTTGAQTSIMAPDVPGEDNDANTGGVPLPQADGNTAARGTGEDTAPVDTDDAPNIVYVTETVSAQ